MSARRTTAQAASPEMVPFTDLSSVWTSLLTPGCTTPGGRMYTAVPVPAAFSIAAASSAWGASDSTRSSTLPGDSCCSSMNWSISLMEWAAPSPEKSGAEDFTASSCFDIPSTSRSASLLRSDRAASSCRPRASASSSCRVERIPSAAPDISSSRAATSPAPPAAD